MPIIKYLFIERDGNIDVENLTVELWSDADILCWQRSLMLTWFQKYKSCTKVNMKLIWEFDVENIPFELLSNVGIFSCGIITFTLTLT